MYTQAFRDLVMNYYHNESHSERQTAKKFNIASTTVSYWKQEDEGKREKTLKRKETDVLTDINAFNEVAVESKENNADEQAESLIEFFINDYKIKINCNNLSLLLRSLNND